METTAYKRYVFIDYLKIISMLMVLYCHLIPMRYTDIPLVQGIQNYINVPFGLIQDFGALGVVIFLIVSGFLSTHYLYKKVTFSGALNFLVKIYGSVILSVMFFWLVNKIIELMIGPTFYTQFPLKVWLKDAFLINAFTGSVSINSPLWFMVPMLCFRLLVLLLSLVPKMKEIIKVLIIEGLLFINIILSFIFDSFTSIFLLRFSFIHVILIGVFIKLYIDNKLSTSEMILMQLINLICLTFAFVKFGAESGYMISVAWGILLFIVFYMLNAYMNQRKMVTYISLLSIDVYMLHFTIGSLLQTLFVDIIIPDNKYLAIGAGILSMFVICIVYNSTVSKCYNLLWQKAIKTFDRRK